MTELEGRTIRKITVSESAEELRFDTDKGPLTYRTLGDCCSISWFHEVLGVEALLGHRVRLALGVPMSTIKAARPSANRDSNIGKYVDDSIEEYAIHFVTDGGYADIVYRNASNGYYGGYHILCKDNPELPIEIVEDWTA